MTTRPLILLTLGGTENLADAHRELRRIEEGLEARAREFGFEVKTAALLDAEAAARTFSTYSDRIDVLHYAGHADGAGLTSDGADGLLASGLAEYFAPGAAPRVVVLNGCSTLAQVDVWLARGAQAVVATARPIRDDLARRFAETFFAELADRASVNDAFAAARKTVNLTEDSLVGAPETRPRTSFLPGGTTAPVDLPAADPPWGLYLHPDHGRAGANYRLPWYRGQILTKVRQMNFQDGKARKNIHLLRVLQHLADHDLSMPGKVEAADHYEAELFDLLVESYPWTLGYPLSKLAKATQPRRRMELFRDVALALGRTLYYVALSEWNWLRYAGHLTAEEVKPPSWEPSPGEVYPRLNYWERFRTTQTVLAKAIAPDAERAVPELSDLAASLAESAGELPAVVAFFEADDETYFAADVRQGEYYLASLLQATAFLAGYEVLAVRHIAVSAAQGRSTVFAHSLGKLYANNNSKLELRSDKKNLDRYYYSRAVVMTRRDADAGDPLLTLSPLIIDVNSHYPSPNKDENSKLRIFSYAYQKQGLHYWMATNYDATHGDATGMKIHSEMTAHEFETGRPAGGNPWDDVEADPHPILAEVTEDLRHLAKNLGHGTLH